MWSPKTKSDGSKNTFYDNMAKVSPGDIVFSFYKTRIPCIGIITSHGYSQNKPEFGASGAAWGTDGWMVNVDYQIVKNAIIPKKHLDAIIPLLPPKYSPLQQNGNGNQGVYLAELSQQFGEKLLELIGDEVSIILRDTHRHSGTILLDNEAEENRIEKLIRNDGNLSDTETEAIVNARKGQGKFRENVIKTHRFCPFTGISNPLLLKASHIKPWAKCKSHKERLDPMNGLPLSPTADHLFDQGYISFGHDGKAIFSGRITEDEFELLGIFPKQKIYSLMTSATTHLQYFEFHRKYIFKP